jgi:hypothetical protein
MVAVALFPTITGEGAWIETLKCSAPTDVPRTVCCLGGGGALGAADALALGSSGSGFVAVGFADAPVGCDGAADGCFDGAVADGSGDSFADAPDDAAGGVSMSRGSGAADAMMALGRADVEAAEAGSVEVAGLL